MTARFFVRRFRRSRNQPCRAIVVVHCALSDGRWPVAALRRSPAAWFGQAVLRPEKQHGGRGRDALFASLEAQVLGGRRLDRHGVGRNSHHLCEGFAHPVDVGPQTGPLHHHRAVRIADFVSCIPDHAGTAGQQQLRVDVPALLRSIREMQPDVTQRGCAQQRIAQGMDQHVAVGMGDTALFMGDFHAADDQPEPFAQRMHVVSLSDSEWCHHAIVPLEPFPDDLSGKGFSCGFSDHSRTDPPR